MSFNPTTDQVYAVVQNGSNVVGAGAIAIDAITNPLVQGANIFQCTVVPTAADPTDTAATFTWVANGAGLTNDAGAAVAGQPTQRSFTTTATGQFTSTCTVTMTTGAGGVGQGPLQCHDRSRHHLGVAIVSGVGILFTRVNTRIHDLDKRIDVFI